MSGAAAPTPTTPSALRRAARGELAPQRDPAGDEVKAELRAHTDVAIERGVFGVPTFELDGRLFWGLDALPMLRAALQGDAWFDGPAWDEAGTASPGRSAEPLNGAQASAGPLPSVGLRLPSGECPRSGRGAVSPSRQR